jgi:hypothetical protein
MLLLTDLNELIRGVLYQDALESFLDFKIRQVLVFHTVKYVDDFVILAKEEPVLQGMIDSLIKF